MDTPCPRLGALLRTKDDDAQGALAEARNSPACLHAHEQISMLGLQLVWSTEMAYASPYLLSLGARSYQPAPQATNRLTCCPIILVLPRRVTCTPTGLSKAGMSAVFLAGPLSGKIGLLVCVRSTRTWLTAAYCDSLDPTSRCDA